MSKCQKNKYFNVGSQPCKMANPEFQGSLSKLLADREKQDFALASTSVASASVASLAKVKALVPSVAKASKSDIDIILGNF
jgi:hypothetical protein